MFKKDHINENGSGSPVKKDRSEDSRIKNSNRETTDLDNAAHRIGQVSSYVPQEHLNVKIAKEGDIMKNCAGH